MTLLVLLGGSSLGTPPTFGSMAGAFGSLTATANGHIATVVPGTAAAPLGSLTATISGTVIPPTMGVMTASFGFLQATLLTGAFPHYWEADLQRSPWRADLSILSDW